MINNKLIIGLTGPIGSGKSQVVKLLENHNIFIINADQVTHNLLNKNLDLYNDIIDNFSIKIINNKKLIDRRKLGNIVFSNKKKLDQLNNIIFPYIKTEIINIINSCDNNYKIILLDAPTLIQSNLYKICDIIIVVMADRKIRQARIMLRDKLTISQSEKRLNSQLDDEQYLKKADYVIYNNKDISDLKNEIDSIFKEIIK